MRLKKTKKCLWITLVILIFFLMILECQVAADSVRIYQDPTFDYYVSLLWEILKRITVIMPMWLLSLLGLVRSYLGENWFPFAVKIPVYITKSILAVTTILLIGVYVAEVVYTEQSKDPYTVQYMMEKWFDGLKTILSWTLFYGVLLYIEQWCISQNYSLQNIRKKQLWVVVTLFLTLTILFELSCVDLWYIPLSSVNSPNTLEDYYLWWFSLYLVVFILPLWFFSIRKTVRVFKDNKQWLTLSTILSPKSTILITLAVTGLMVWQIQECRDWSKSGLNCDIPEYAEAAVMAHLFQAMMCGLAVFYTLCLLLKQILVVRREKREQ